MREKANAKFGEPLTLEQLLEMNGKPVWTKLLVESTGRKEGWTLIYNDDGYAAVQRWTQSPLWYKDYGKIWIAYAYPPVHIDREKWEPCECCRSAKFMNGQSMYNFCPSCGRPLTDEAWEDLEKTDGRYA